MADPAARNTSDAAAIIEHVRAHGQTTHLAIDGATFLLTPNGSSQDITDKLDKLRPAPHARSGTEEVHDLASLIAQIQRYGRSWAQVWGSLLLNADGKVAAMGLTAILDAPEGAPSGAPAWGRHRIHYAFPLSREWQSWAAIDGEPLNQADLAAFLERRLGDVVPEPTSLYSDPATGEQRQTTAITDPAILKLVTELDKRVATPGELVKIARSFTVNQSRKAEISTDRDTGDIKVAFEEQGIKSAETVRVPNLILVQAPVVVNGEPFLMAVHFRYRVVNGSIRFALERHQPERVLELVFGEAVEAVREATGLAPIRGTPPQWLAR